MKASYILYLSLTESKKIVKLNITIAILIINVGKVSGSLEESKDSKDGKVIGINIATNKIPCIFVKRPFEYFSSFR